MPRRGNPLKLYTITKRNMIKLLEIAVHNWITLLCDEWAFQDERWYETIELIFRQTDQLHIYLSQIPESPIRSIAKSALKTASNIIEMFHVNVHAAPAIGFRADEADFTCLKIIRSLFFRSMDMLNLTDLSHNFTQALCISSMCYFTRITSLKLGVQTRTNHSLFAAQNIHRLINLKDFQYVFHCTNEVVRQMSRHCLKLEYIMFRFSENLNNQCVADFLQLRGIIYLDLVKTGLTDFGYSMLIQHLPNLGNITWHNAIDNLLRFIPDERTIPIIQFQAPIDSALFITQKCPNIRNLVLFNFHGDMSPLGTLVHLDQLTIGIVDFIACNLSAVFEQLGHRITQLQLKFIYNLKIEDVILKCVIKRLDIVRCVLRPVQDNRIFNSSLPHYRMMKSMRWQDLHGHDAIYTSLFKYYINIERFIAIKVPSFTDDQIYEAVLDPISTTGLKKLVLFIADDCTLTLDSACLLVIYCDSLKLLGNVKSWGMTRYDTRLFRNCLRRRNIAVKVRYEY